MCEYNGQSRGSERESAISLSRGLPKIEIENKKKANIS
jgi:hypothetical protein